MSLNDDAHREDSPEPFPTSTPTRKLSTYPFHDFNRPPQRIGPYRILETLGEGGMGVVYLAEQTEPVERRVALKVIKLGMDTKEVVARFESERQALALMDHPNIARILEGGVTEGGRPFFVMEHVPGESITSYCDRHKLRTEERLRLFAQVCRGVQHAHQKGIIHRDIKPSNIQVMVQDGVPIPKIIDFGVAKATNRRLTEKTVFTEQGQLIGTPAYMSPEQAEMTGLNVDTTTDIYSLGVLLYELLVGVLPYDEKTLRSKSLAEMHQLIREVDPPRPSTRLSGIGEVALLVAARRQTDIFRLQRQLRGELDWIILKAMEKDRTRRYSSASELAADIDRFLNHQPLLAHAPSTMYQLKKMMRRHTTAVGFVGSVLILIIGFGIWMSVLYTRAVRAESEAQKEAETAKQVSDFMVEMFGEVDPNRALGETITAKEVLDTGSEKIERELANQPLIQARLMDTMGQVYGSLGLNERGVSLLETALKVRERELGPKSLEVASTLYNLGTMYQSVNNLDLSKALSYYERSLRIREDVLGSDDIDTAWSRYRVGASNSFLGNVPAAEENLKQALQVFERKLGPEHWAVSWALNDLAVIPYNQGDYDQAIEYLQRALEIKRKNYEPNHPDLAGGMNALGYALIKAGRYDEAEPLLRESVNTMKQVLGPEHIRFALALHSLGEVLRLTGRYQEAEECFEQALAVQNKQGEESLDLSETLLSLGALRRAQGRYEESEKFLLQAIRILENVATDHPFLPGCLEEYSALLEESGHPDKAAVQRDEAERIRSARNQ